MFAQKRSPECSSSEPPRKFHTRQLRASSVVSCGSWMHENASRKTIYPPKDDRRSERSSARNDFERRPSSSEVRINPFSRSSPLKPEEDLEPPGTGSSTLHYSLSPRVSFLTWKDRLYRELEELNCLFTIEPTTRKKANMTVEEELTYRNLAKAIICMRLDDAHLALVSNVEDPLKVMKVLSDFREPELRHLEMRAQQRLNSTVYHAAVPVCDFIRTFENLLKEVEKYSGERMSDNTMKQHLLSAVIGDFPDIMVGSKAIRYDDLKKLLIEAAQRRSAAEKAELEQRNVASLNASATERRSAAASVASQNVEVSEKQLASKMVEVKAQRTGKVDEQRSAGTNAAAVSQGLESRIGAGKIVETNNYRPTGSIVGDRNVKVERPTPAFKAPNNNILVKEQLPIVKDQRPAVQITNGKQVACKNAQENERHSVDTTVANQSSVNNERCPIISSPVHEGSNGAEDSNVIEQRPNVKPLEDERPFSARDVKANEQRFVAKSVADERAPPARDARTNERRPGTNAASRNADVDDPRPIGVKNAEANQRRLANSDAVGKNLDADERCCVSAKSAVTDANAVSKSGALYERRAPKSSAPAPKDELKEQLELDRRLQEQIESSSRPASKEVSCTKCGAFGHVVRDCKRKDNRRKCYCCLQFVDDHVASTCPHWGECAAMPKTIQPRTNSKFAPEPKPKPSTKPLSSSPPFGRSPFFADNCPFAMPPEILENDEDEDEEDEDDLPLVDGLRQVYHIRRKMTTKKLKTGRTARKDLIFTDSDFYTDVEYREMFIEEDEQEPGDIILETIKVMSTNQN